MNVLYCSAEWIEVCALCSTPVYIQMFDDMTKFVTMKNTNIDTELKIQKLQLQREISNYFFSFCSHSRKGSVEPMQKF